MKMKLTLLALLGLFLLSRQTAYAETVFVFNPEARIGEIQAVRFGMDNYLKSKGISADVYIFANPDDFEDSVARLKPDTAIVAAYYYKSMKERYGWTRLLSGRKKGEKTFAKILVSALSVKDPLALRNKSIAAISLGSSSMGYIESQLPPGLSAKDIRIVAVSKDIDAIMALGFEQVEAAIVMRSSFEKLRQINPDAVENLHILQELMPVEYPVVSAFPRGKALVKFKETFRQMPYKGPAKKILRFFGVTAFQAESSPKEARGGKQ